ncbi:MAG TPA: hypothetical protein VFJ63_03995 [Candidatus Bathyarchaeia archaeon]|nr:hypothetical protein [Candidatus Bathyarchaeia archaeon]
MAPSLETCPQLCLVTSTAQSNILRPSVRIVEADSRPIDFVAEREEMVRGLIREGLLRSANAIAAMKKVPRELFVPVHLQAYAYNDSPLPTEHGQTISAPHG